MRANRPLRDTIFTVFLVTSCAGPRQAPLVAVPRAPVAEQEHRQPDLSSDGLLNVDFVEVFPHKFWISSWSSDSQYPAGFRYKLMSARREPDNVVHFLIVLEQRSGDKEVLSSLDINAPVFDRVAAEFVDGLAAKHGLDFEEQDFSSCRTLADFDKEVARRGWTSTEPPEAGQAARRTR
jgi:hypothetical protein